MKVIYAVWDRAPYALEWPLDDQDHVILKLDRLAPANGFTTHNAHDALGDVEATIHRATLFRDRAPAAWRDASLTGKNMQSLTLCKAGFPCI